MGTETVAFAERQRQVGVIGTTHEALEVRRLSRRLAAASCPDLDWDRGAPVVVLGQTVARELFPGRDPLGQIVRVGDWRMRVVGVLAPRGPQLGLDMDDVAIVPVATAMRILNRRSLFRVLIEVRAHADLAGQARVVRLLAARHRAEDVTVITQDAVIGALSAILRALTLALAGIAGVSLAVAGVGIMNVMLVSVSERTREIGLLKALGAGRRQILARVPRRGGAALHRGRRARPPRGLARGAAARRRLPRAAGDAAALGRGRGARPLAGGGRRLRRHAGAPRRPARPGGGARAGDSRCATSCASPWAPCAATGCARPCRCSASPSASPRSSC